MEAPNLKQELKVNILQSKVLSIDKDIQLCQTI